jgi:hypothetical protein
LTPPAPASAIASSCCSRRIKSSGTLTRDTSRSAGPDQDNVYKLRVPAGDYYAVAFEQDDPLVSLNDPEILQQLRDRATKVTLGNADKKTLALTLSEPPIY